MLSKIYLIFCLILYKYILKSSEVNQVTSEVISIYSRFFAEQTI